EDYTSAITPDEPVLSTEEPDNSLSMGDEHLDTIPATESDEFIKSGGIKASNDNPILFYDPIISGTPPNLTPSGESDFFLEVDAFLAVKDEFTSSQFPKSYLDPEGDMLLFGAFLNDDHSSDFKTNDDQSSSDEDVLEKIILKPLCEEEIIHMESLRTHDSSLLISSKIDSLLEEFAGELTLLKSIPPGIDETDCDFEEDIRLIEKLLYDNSSPRPPEEFVSANSDAKFKSFSPSPILFMDSDSLMEEIDLFCTLDYPMPLSIEDKDYDSKRDSLIPKDLPSNNTLSFAKKESFHFDIPPFSHPPTKPPDVKRVEKSPVSNGINSNPIRCYNCQGEGYYASNYIVKPRKRDVAYLQQHLQITQKEEAGIQCAQEKFEFITAADAYEETERVKANCILENNLQQASHLVLSLAKLPSMTHTDQLSKLKMALCYQNPFYLKQAQQKQQSLYNGKVLLEKHDPPAVYDSEETLELTQESRLKMKQLNKEIKPTNYTKINHLSGVFVSQTAKSREELYFSNTSKTVNVSKLFSIPNEEFSNDTTPSVARKILNEVKRTIATLSCCQTKNDFGYTQLVVFCSPRSHKIVKDEIFLLVNQVAAIVPNFEIQFLNEAAKFVRDLKSLAKEADESLSKHKALELEIESLLRAVVSQDIMLVTAYNDMQQKIEWLQAQLGDLKGKSKDTPCVSDTLNPLPQKLKNENVELEFQVRNYEKENAYLKTAYENLFDSINMTRTQTKTIIDYLQTKLHDTIYENAKLRAQLFDKVSEQKDTTRGTSANTKFAKQSIMEKPPSSRPKLYAITPLPKSTAFPKVGETNALSNQVTSNSIPSFQESNVVKNDNVLSPRIFRMNPFKASRVDNFMPNKHVKASVRIKPTTVSQPHVITKNDVNSETNGFSSKDVSSTRTKRPQPKNNPKNDKVPYKSKSSWISNNLEKIKENHKNLQSSSNQKHMSSECNNIKLSIRNAKSESWKVYSVICSMNYSNGENQVVSKSTAVTTADASDKRQQQQDSTSSTSTLATTITADGNSDL
nr:hypothetical protein [Tanacetum cinerariifolium]